MTGSDAEARRRLIDALCDADRLRVAGRLAERSWTITELASELKLKPQAVARHFAALDAAGLLMSDPEGAGGKMLDADELRRLSRQIHFEEDRRFADEDDETAKVLRRFFDGERLTSLPVQRGSRLIVLQRLAAGFEPRAEYPEREVNEMLGEHQVDHAALRRALVDEGLMARERGVYRRIEGERLP